MITLTRKQREALEKVFNRGPIYPYLTYKEKAQGIRAVPLTYKQFRRTIVRGDYGCIMVGWCNMWLGIERDGHTHS